MAKEMAKIADLVKNIPLGAPVPTEVLLEAKKLYLSCKSLPHEDAFMSTFIDILMPQSDPATTPAHIAFPRIPTDLLGDPFFTTFYKKTRVWYGGSCCANSILIPAQTIVHMGTCDTPEPGTFYRVETRGIMAKVTKLSVTGGITHKANIPFYTRNNGHVLKVDDISINLDTPYIYSPAKYFLENCVYLYSSKVKMHLPLLIRLRRIPIENLVMLLCSNKLRYHSKIIEEMVKNEPTEKMIRIIEYLDGINFPKSFYEKPVDLIYNQVCRTLNLPLVNYFESRIIKISSLITSCETQTKFTLLHCVARNPASPEKDAVIKHILRKFCKYLLTIEDAQGMTPYDHSMLFDDNNSLLNPCPWKYPYVVMGTKGDYTTTFIVTGKKWLLFTEKYSPGSAAAEQITVGGPRPYEITGDTITLHPCGQFKNADSYPFVRN